MSDLVVDSSVVAKWVLPEADSAHALRLISETALITRTQADALLQSLLQSPINAESATRLLNPAFQIAVRYDRAIYDALFVALARDLALPGITADEPLYNAVHADFPEIILLRNWP